ncbi:hypothetical protein QTO34_018327 [Cnephaeus nilssonii]|uniref:Uncharacterized protein n=1 Tax=Cnephaeus nilssonii TaxID=3371016 RepID=A0AA40HZE1_CNENI|nr:hypothetical protein QTO34_018327 [Eptesicus nilssonii]
MVDRQPWRGRHVKSYDSLKARPLAPHRQPSCECKGKFWREMKSAPPGNTQMIRMQNSLIADTENALVGWIQHQSSHNILLSQS